MISSAIHLNKVIIIIIIIVIIIIIIIIIVIIIIINKTLLRNVLTIVLRLRLIDIFSFLTNFCFVLFHHVHMFVIK